MTFLVCYHGESYTLDIETLDDLATLADKSGWVKLDILGFGYIGFMFWLITREP